MIERGNSCQPSASLQDFQVAELADELQVVLDEEDHLLLVDLAGKVLVFTMLLRHICHMVVR